MIDVKLTMDEIKIDTSLLSQEHFKQFASKEILLTQARQKIEWNQGKAWDGQAIRERPYSKQYEKIKRDAGRKTSPVNLTFSGDLQQAWQMRETDDGAEAYYLSTPHPKPKRQEDSEEDISPDITNAQLAVSLSRRGFNVPGTEFGIIDSERISKNYDLEVKKVVENLITVDKKG